MDREKKRLTRESERERERERERQRERAEMAEMAEREQKKKLVETFGQRLKKQNLSIYGRFLCRCRVYGSLIIPNKQTRVM